MALRAQALAKTVLAIAEKIEEHESKWRSSQAKVRVATPRRRLTTEQPQPKELVPKEQRSVFTMLGQLGVLLALLGAYLYWSWREEDKADETHKCAFCGGEVVRDTSRILSYTDAQALEVTLGAATYEAGKCGGCRRTQNIRRLAFRRGAVRPCDYCRNHTAIESETFVVDEKAQVRVPRGECYLSSPLAEADASAAEGLPVPGLRQVVVHRGAHCVHLLVRFVPIAIPAADLRRISEDSSSAPSGFGGGSTSGGGSGRSF